MVYGAFDEKEKEDNPDSYKAYEELLTWYFDSFLTYAAGQDYWGVKVKPYHLAIQKKEMYGETVTLVSAQRYVYYTVF